MSDFPGYPSPYSTWNQFTSARTAVPIGNFPIPGLVSGVSSLPSSAYFPLGLSSLADPLSPLVSSSYRSLPPLPALPSRFLPRLGDVPGFALEPTYGCGLQEPRNLLHSPNFVFSQNPSPLTFDQVYRSSGCSSVSPVSQYRSQFDQRCVNSRLLLTGRLSEPLPREPNKTSTAKTSTKDYELSSGAKERSVVKDNKEKSEAKSSETVQAKPAKIWNPFESESSKDQKQKEDSQTKSKYCSESVTKSGDNRVSSHKSEVNVDANGNTLTKSSNEIRPFPKQPVPLYPIKPIPIYDKKRHNSQSISGKPREDFFHTVSPLTHLSQFSSKHLSNKARNEAHLNYQHRPKCHEKKSDKVDAADVIIIDDESDSASSNVKYTDVNQNNENNKNCNLNKEGTVELNTGSSSCHSKSNANEDNVDLGESTCNSSNFGGQVSSGVSAVENQIEGSSCKVDYDTNQLDFNYPVSNIPEGGFSFVKFVNSTSIDPLDIHSIVYHESSCTGQSVSYTCPVSQQTAVTACIVNDTSVNNTTDTPLQNDNGKIEKEIALEIKIPDISVDDQTTDGDIKSPLCSPSKCGKDSKSKPCSSKCSKISKKDELSALSNQVNEIRNRRNSINRDKDGGKLLSPTQETVNTTDFTPPGVNITKDFIVNPQTSPRRRMAAAGTTVTMLKNSEDSLSASISSSQISDTDEDTQMSNENAEKLYPAETQSSNTHDTYVPPSNPEPRSYMPPINSGNMNCGNQYYKSNNAPMCQTLPDNQKPYLCVQDQNQFNEKSDVMPQYSCYDANQSSNVLPVAGNFEAHDEESSSYPQPSQTMEHTLDSSVDYDENSMMSESHGVETECDSQHSATQNIDSPMRKPGTNSSQTEKSSNVSSFMTDSDQALQWEFLHSKQYIDNIYCKQTGCEVVKLEDSIRESDSPKTFLDLDKTTQEKKAQIKHDFVGKDFGNAKHFGGKSFSRGGYSGYRGHSQGSYGNQSYDMYSNTSGNRWHNYGNQSKMANDGDGSHYEQNQNHYRNNYQGGFSSMNQGQNGGDKAYNQSGFHGNEYNQNESNFYNQNQSKPYQGNYGNGARYDGNYYQNKGSGDYNSQNNMYPPSSDGQRYSGQGYGPGQGGYGQHYTQQSPSHSNMMGQFQNNPNQNYNIPRNASPASTGSEFGPVMEPVKKKRGRKRKVEKEALDENKPRPNTIVTAPTNIGPLIDIDNPDCPIETYDYNNQIETIFNFSIEDDLSPIGAQFLDIEKRVCQKLMPIKYGHPVNVIYNPLTYAFQTHRDFITKFCNSERTILFLGMNPGPYGMSQNGVPFGEATAVREWLKITGDIYKPEVEHPKKPVTGLACTRNEVSGARFWGLFQKICLIPENFFRHSYVYNFCPLAYMSESGKNITPPQLVHSELDQINEACDTGLVELVKLMNIRIIIAVGKFVQQRASKALHNAGIMNIKVECILHPSPINPHANKGWEQIVAKQLIEMNVMQYLNPDMEAVQRQINEWEKVAASNVKLTEIDTI